MVYYKLCGISVPVLLLDYLPHCNDPSHHSVAAVVQLQHLCPFSDLLRVAQLLKSYHVLLMGCFHCGGFSTEQLASLWIFKFWYVNNQGRVKGTFTPLGIAKKQNDCWGWIVRNSIAYKDIVLVVACYHLLADTRHCDHIICALDQDEMQNEIHKQKFSILH